METNMLIKKIHMSCPLCDKTHEIEERKRITTITLKGEEVAYEERFYFCANADDENQQPDSTREIRAGAGIGSPDGGVSP